MAKDNGPVHPGQGRLTWAWMFTTIASNESWTNGSASATAARLRHRHGYATMIESAFSPTNALEHALLDAQEGNRSSTDFLSELLGSQVFVLLDREIGPKGHWDESINLCVLTNATDGPVVAAFTSPERSIPWHERLPQFGHGLLVDFSWLLQGLGPEVGVVINPGWSVGVELAPEAVERLKRRLEDSGSQ